MCSVDVYSKPRMKNGKSATAGIIITLHYYRTWFYYHKMALRGCLAIVFHVQLPNLFTVYNLQCMLIYSVRAAIQVCSSVENVSIYTSESSDLNWKLLHPMHIFRDEFVFAVNMRCCSLYF